MSHVRVFDPTHSDIATLDPSLFALAVLNDKGAIPVDAKGLAPNRLLITCVKLDLSPRQERKAVPVMIERIHRAGEELAVVNLEPADDLDQKFIS